MHIVHGELRKEPYVKHNCGQDGQTTMFVIELSEVIKDYRTGDKTYTNYNAALFAKTPAHIEHLQKTLVVGNWAVVNCEKLKIKKSDCGQYINLDMDNARLEGSGYIDGGQVNNAPQQQGGYNQAPQQQAPQQQAPQNHAHLYNNQPQQQQAPQQGGFNQHQQQAPQQGGYNQAPQQQQNNQQDQDIPF